MSWTLIPLLILVACDIIIGGNAHISMVQCFLRDRNCHRGGINSTLPLDTCKNANGLSYIVPDTGECVNFPIRFGFEQTSLVMVERRDKYSVNMGFLEGALDQELMVTVNVILGTARSSDLRLNTPTIVFSTHSYDTELVIFTLKQDFVAQEYNETFTFKLNFERSLFEPNDTVIILDELSVTILDADEVDFRFSESEYYSSEAQDVAVPVRIIKDTDERLANPVVLRVTPLTVDDALDMGIIGSFQPEQSLTPEQIQRSPIRADYADFNKTSFNIQFPADEDEDAPITGMDAPIPIVDDDIDEAESQRFIVSLDVAGAVSPENVDIDRSVTTCTIQDDDGFSRPTYTYYEPPFLSPISNVTLVKDDNRVSEQTFLVILAASEAPDHDLVPATLETVNTTAWDYRIDSPGQRFIVTQFAPTLQEMTVTFYLNGDNLPERQVEVFQFTFFTSMPTVGFPSFSPAQRSSTTAFFFTRIEIIDDDLARVGWEQLNYTISEMHDVGQACVIVFNPPTDFELGFDILLEYQSATGTADGNDFHEITEPTPLTIHASDSSTDSRRTCVQYSVLHDFVSEEVESFTLILNFKQPTVIIDPSVTEIFIVDSDESQNASGLDDSVIIIITVMSMVAFCLIVFCIVAAKLFRWSRKRNANNIEHIPLEVSGTMRVRRSLQQDVPRHLMVSSCNLELVESVGQGEYGIVYRAKLFKGFDNSYTQTVAVKTLKGFMDKSIVRGLLQECTKMSTFDHPNVLAVCGVCVDGGPAPYIIMPFMFNGSLLSYLKKKREELVLSSDLGAETFRVSAKLTNICFQVAKGMEYLSSCKVVHRDLAARNCMIDLNFVIKVADFGLSETIDPSKDYFRQDNTEGLKLPVKWLAPECLSDGIFSEKSDVWAFGVTCWEVFSGGMMPYSGINPADLPHMLVAGYRMEKPQNWACQSNVYDIMVQCWAIKRENRPTFSELVTTLSRHMEDMSGYTPLQFDEKSP